MLDSGTPKVLHSHRLMSKRLISTTLLSFALLFAQGGSFLIASLCPHLRTGVMRCDTPAEEPAMDHQHMADMQMDQETDEYLFNPHVSAFNRPAGTCNHCAVHSRTTSSVFSVRHVEASKRAAIVGAIAFSRLQPTIRQHQERLTGRSHGPPGEPVSRYILIDVFRI